MVKVKAATLLETIIAMVIILVVFLISGMVFISNAKSGDTATKIRALNAVNTCVEEYQPGELPMERTFSFQNFRIFLRAERSARFPNMVKVRCTAIDLKNTTLAETKKLKSIR